MRVRDLFEAPLPVGEETTTPTPAESKAEAVANKMKQSQILSQLTAGGRDIYKQLQQVMDDNNSTNDNKTFKGKAKGINQQTVNKIFNKWANEQELVAVVSNFLAHYGLKAMVDPSKKEIFPLDNK